MKYHKQLISHDPENNKWGDCWRTCIACVLDLEPEEVPHFGDGNPDDAVEVGRAWLQERGIRYFCMPLSVENIDQVFRWMDEYYDSDLEYLLVGRSSIGVNHVIICRNNKIIHDTSGNGIEGPCDDGYFWLEILFRPLNEF